jgi:hypothetical protein
VADSSEGPSSRLRSLVGLGGHVGLGGLISGGRELDWMTPLDWAGSEDGTSQQEQV